MNRETLFWHYPHYWSNTRVRLYGVVRAGDWKLIENYEDMSVELYNLKDDLSEAHDLAKERPKQTDTLRKMLYKWRESADAQMPIPNPDFKR